MAVSLARHRLDIRLFVDYDVTYDHNGLMLLCDIFICARTRDLNSVVVFTDSN